MFGPQVPLVGSCSHVAVRSGIFPVTCWGVDIEKGNTFAECGAPQRCADGVVDLVGRVQAGTVDGSDA